MKGIVTDMPYTRKTKYLLIKEHDIPSPLFRPLHSQNLSEVQKATPPDIPPQPVSLEQAKNIQMKSKSISENGQQRIKSIWILVGTPSSATQVTL